jgi:hypothetical protein
LRALRRRNDAKRTSTDDVSKQELEREGVFAFTQGIVVVRQLWKGLGGDRGETG